MFIKIEANAAFDLRRVTICAIFPGHILARICFGFLFLFSCLLKVMIEK